MARGSACLARATNTLEPHGLGIPEALSHSPSVWASAEVSGSFPESPTDSQASLRMTSLIPHVLYKYKALASPKIIIYSLYILTALKPRHLIICEPCTNSSISTCVRGQGGANNIGIINTTLICEEVEISYTTSGDHQALSIGEDCSHGQHTIY